MKRTSKKTLGTMMISLVSASMLLLSACSGGGNAGGGAGAGGAEASYPTKSITGVIQWGAGGACDNVSRAIAPLAEKKLGQSIVLTNKPGATGAIATQYVHDQKSDGYHLLFAAENPTLYGVMNLSKLGFQDFTPVNILARGLAAVVVPADSKYQKMEDLLNDAKAQPGKIKMGSTGPGGISFVVTNMINSIEGTEFNMVPFDGEGPAMTAMLGGHVDVTVSGWTAAAENAKAGKIRVLAVVNDERIKDMPDAPAITESMPDMKKYLPWGPFYGVWVKKDTPDAVKQKLVQAFGEAYKEQAFQDFLTKMGAIPMGITGEEAETFWKDWQSTTAWLIHDAGASKVSPEELNIERKK